MSSLLACCLLLASFTPQTTSPGPGQAPAGTVTAPVEDPAVTALARKIYSQMRTGQVDAALLSDSMNKALSPDVLALQKPVFDQLGDPVKLTLTSRTPVEGGTQYIYLTDFATAQLHVTIFIDAAGKVGGYFLKP